MTLSVRRRVGWAALAGAIGCLLALFVVSAAAYSYAPTVDATVARVPAGQSNIALEHLSAVASFYETIIAILFGVVALLATLAFISIRTLSKIAAEDMAVEAAKQAISDSNSFREDVGIIVDDSVSAALKQIVKLKKGVDQLTNAVADLDGRVSQFQADQHVVGTASPPEE